MKVFTLISSDYLGPEGVLYHNKVITDSKICPLMMRSDQSSFSSGVQRLVGDLYNMQRLPSMHPDEKENGTATTSILHMRQLLVMDKSRIVRLTSQFSPILVHREEFQL